MKNLTNLNSLCLGTLIALSLCFSGCKDDEQPIKQVDGQTTASDGGKEQGGPDMGPAQDQALADQSTDAPRPHGTDTCLEVNACFNECTDKACDEGCIQQGTLEAQEQFFTMRACIDAITAGACAEVCKVLSDMQCQKCRAKACSEDVKICEGGGGAVIDGFGDPCNPQNTCSNDLVCLSSEDETDGYCSTKCENPSWRCPGVPSGTAAYCIVPSGALYYCAFLCKTEIYEFNCPTGFKCNDEPGPSSTTTYRCIPDIQ